MARGSTQVLLRARTLPHAVARGYEIGLLSTPHHDHGAGQQEHRSLRTRQARRRAIRRLIASSGAPDALAPKQPAPRRVPARSATSTPTDSAGAQSGRRAPAPVRRRFLWWALLVERRMTDLVEPRTRSPARDWNPFIRSIPLTRSRRRPRRRRPAQLHADGRRTVCRLPEHRSSRLYPCGGLPLLCWSSPRRIVASTHDLG